MTEFSYTQTKDVQHLEVHPSVKRSVRSKSGLREVEDKPKRKLTDLFKIRKSDKNTGTAAESVKRKK